MQYLSISLFSQNLKSEPNGFVLEPPALETTLSQKDPDWRLVGPGSEAALWPGIQRS